MTKIYKIFGEKVKKLRLELGFTQEKLSEVCGLHRTYIAGIEKGRRNISIKNLEKIAKALKVKPDELLK
ncbi:MAG: helix-turn-helix transcriptional regulator [Patescibacteria group bacterium]|nr:helix-turn-helix transcriptional regulator [Patescibacteria group bacterium]